MKKILVLLCAMATLWSCTSEDFDSNSKTADTQQFTVKATFEDSEDDAVNASVGNSKEAAVPSRASLGSNNTVVWDEGDEITFFSINGTSSYDASTSTKSKFTLSAGAGTVNGTFNGVAKISPYGYFAVYPYVENTKIYRSQLYYKGYVTISDLDLTTQEAREGSIPANVPMVAYNANYTSDGVQMQFKNVFAYLKFTIDYKCKSVKLAANDENNDPLMLKTFSIIMEGDGSTHTPSMQGERATNNCINLVGKNGGDIAPGTYYIAVNPTTIANGFKLVFTSVDGTTTFEKSTSKSVSLLRNKIYNLGTIDISSIPCLNGKGTAGEPYEISDYGDLLTMQRLIGNNVSALSGCEAYAGAHYKQTASFDCEGKAITPIGCVNHHNFTGTYDGDNKTISNITYTPIKYVQSSSATTAYWFSSLFGAIRNSTIKNVNIKNPVMSAKNDVNAYSTVSPLVGIACSDDDETNFITNCHVSYDKTDCYELKVYNHLTFGGILAVSSANTKISGCSSNFNLKAQPENESTYLSYWIGGIVGYATAYMTEPGGSKTGHSTDLVIEKCRNNGSITAVGYYYGDLSLGGIIGEVIDYLAEGDVRSLITSCVNSGNLRAEGSSEFSEDKQNFIGGIIGNMDSDGYTSADPYITNCLNKGNLSSTSGKLYAGGIAGKIYDGDTHFEYCVNAGTMNCANNKSTYGYNKGTLSPSLTHCYTTVNVSCNSDCTYKSDLTADYMNDKKGSGYVNWKTASDGTLDLDF